MHSPAQRTRHAVVPPSKVLPGDSTRRDTTRHDTLRYLTIRHDTTRYGTIRYDTIRYERRDDTTRHATPPASASVDRSVAGVPLRTRTSVSPQHRWNRCGASGSPRGSPTDPDHSYRSANFLSHKRNLRDSSASGVSGRASSHRATTPHFRGNSRNGFRNSPAEGYSIFRITNGCIPSSFSLGISDRILFELFKFRRFSTFNLSSLNSETKNKDAFPFADSNYFSISKQAILIRLTVLGLPPKRLNVSSGTAEQRQCIVK